MFWSTERSTNSLPSPFGRGAWGEGNREVVFSPQKALTLTLSQRERGRRGRQRRGQSLVEFAVVALVVYMLLAAILTFGQLLYCSQGVQQAADVAARELARTPLPADDTFSLALSDSGVQSRIFDERYLVLTIDANSNPITFNGGHPIGDFPLVNQQLVPLMVYDQIGGQAVLRYPGAVFTDPNAGATLPVPASGYLVRIPVVSVPASPASATESIINWVSVLEEIPSSASSASTGTGAFPVSSPQQGVVALRINYPYQSASMSGFQPPANPTSPPGPPGNPVVPIVAGGASSTGSPPGVGSPVVSDFEYGPNAGTYGLGQQAAWGTTVTPYRSLISAQAIYRREVFQ